MSAGVAVDCSLQGPAPYNCEGCDLSGRDLSGKDLSNANLKGTTLHGTLFRGVTSLRGADLSGAKIGAGTDFSGCDLTGATLDAAALNGPRDPKDIAKTAVILANATVPFFALGTVWVGLDLSGAHVPDLPHDLTRLDVTLCDLTGFDFSHRSLDTARFRSAVLCGADFSHATLDHVIFGRVSGAPTDLTGARFQFAQIPGQAVFDTATLTRADFSDAVLTQASFLNARMDGTIFDRTDLTTCRFSAPPHWSQDRTHLTSFRQARLNFSDLQTRWSCLDLTDTELVGLTAGTDLTSLEARHAVLTGRNFDGCTLTGCDLSGATLQGASFVRAPMAQAVLQGTSGDKPVFTGANLTGANFNPLDEPGSSRRTVLRGASFAGATLTSAQFQQAHFSPTLTADGKHDVAATFDGAALQNVIATGGDFTAASFTGGVAMNGVTFIGAVLAGANLTGARLGALDQVFAVIDGETDYGVLLAALQGNDRAAVAGVFGRHGIAPPILEIDPVVAGRSWTVKAAQVYTVLAHAWHDSKTSLMVMASASRANLSRAFMPGTLLTDANLYNVDASEIEIWPAGADKQLAGAIMDEIDLSNAILGADEQIDLSEASLHNAHLSGAFLVNAKFARASLNGALFNDAQLQGADFTAAAMAGASLANAAVAVDATPDTAGVLLFDLQGSLEGSDGDYETLCAELAAAAAQQFDVVPHADDHTLYDQVIADLGSGNLDRVRAAFRHHRIALGELTLKPLADLAWELASVSAGIRTAYTIWAIPEEAEIVARPPLTTLDGVLFDQYQIVLQRTATVANETDDGGNWIVDNDSGNPKNLTTGYVKFLVRRDAKAATLTFYGTDIHATRGYGQLQMLPIQVGPTVLRDSALNDDRPYLDATTMCPNGVPWAQNLGNGESWESAMRTQFKPPKPPTCVPSPIAGCRQS